MSIMSIIGIVIIIILTVFVIYKSDKGLSESISEGEKRFVDEWEEKEKRKIEIRKFKEEQQNKFENYNLEKKNKIKAANQGHKIIIDNHEDTRGSNNTFHIINGEINKHNNHCHTENGEINNHNNHCHIINGDLENYNNTAVILRYYNTFNKTYNDIIASEFPFYIGRDNSNDLVINDLMIAGKHCRLVKRENGIWMEDLGTVNKLRIDGIIRDSVLLEDYMHICIGDVEFVIGFKENDMNDEVFAYGKSDMGDKKGISFI